jgi:hypothetical protein
MNPSCPATPHNIDFRELFPSCTENNNHDSNVNRILFSPARNNNHNIINHSAANLNIRRTTSGQYEVGNKMIKMHYGAVEWDCTIPSVNNSNHHQDNSIDPFAIQWKNLFETANNPISTNNHLNDNCSCDSCCVEENHSLHSTEINNPIVDSANIMNNYFERKLAEHNDNEQEELLSSTLNQRPAAKNLAAQIPTIQMPHGTDSTNIGANSSIHSSTPTVPISSFPKEFESKLNEQLNWHVSYLLQSYSLLSSKPVPTGHRNQQKIKITQKQDSMQYIKDLLSDLLILSAHDERSIVLSTAVKSKLNDWSTGHVQQLIEERDKPIAAQEHAIVSSACKRRKLPSLLSNRAKQHKSNSTQFAMKLLGNHPNNSINHNNHSNEIQFEIIQDGIEAMEPSVEKSAPSTIVCGDLALVAYSQYFSHSNSKDKSQHLRTRLTAAEVELLVRGVVHYQRCKGYSAAHQYLEPEEQILQMVQARFLPSQSIQQIQTEMKRSHSTLLTLIAAEVEQPKLSKLSSEEKDQLIAGLLQFEGEKQRFKLIQQHYLPKFTVKQLANFTRNLVGRVRKENP